ncbi:MAG: pyridoxamine 5'-phosphate oxidase family protein [Dysgonamonadaceae bacterium]|jgi:uncharacterized pyridoxamine 5'-phosphate oxidase family protein|nr:pyridoxamine 5'-phosphate oxidase family protein [Dysgonamonadaceae bacterium]
MDLREIYDFLKQNRDIAFATVGNAGKPKIRVLQMMKIDEQTNTIYFATSPKKEVFVQLQSKPVVELLAMSGNISVRISGDAVFNVSDKICREIYDTNAVLSRLYNNYQDLAYFSVPIDSVDYFDLTPTPPIFINSKL